MTCKLHIPSYYDPVLMLSTCPCGAVVLTDAERLQGPKPRSTSMSADKGWFKRQMERTKEDVKELPEWLRNPAREGAAAPTQEWWEKRTQWYQAELQRMVEVTTDLRATLSARDAALQDVTAQRDKWLDAFNRSEQFQNGPTKRAEAAERALSDTVQALKALEDMWKRRGWHTGEYDECADDLERLRTERGL